MARSFDLTSHFAGQIKQAASGSAKMLEPVIATVTDNKDPSKLGRVKVKIPVMSQDDSTKWAPIIMQGASKNRGWFFIPEVDDEVVVMFEQGDINRPVVVAALWNGKDDPPDSNTSGQNPHRIIKSRQGSKITFDDENYQIIIEDGSNKGKITIDANANKITIEALEGDVCFQAKNSITINAKSVSMSAQGNLDMHSSGTMAMGSDGGSASISGESSTNMGSAAHSSNGGGAAKPQQATTSPQEIPDPYGS